MNVVPLSDLVEAVVVEALRKSVPSGAEAVVRRSEFADFQANGALPAAKKAGRNPREVAADAVEAMAGDLFEAVEVSGPGFINLNLPTKALWRQVAEQGAGVPQAWAGKKVYIDYSAPNVAKEMHVGHLRSTCIGDALAHMAEAVGAEVVRKNHVGDWGTQFGMLIQYLEENSGAEWHEGISQLNALYKKAVRVFDEEAEFAARARDRVSLLQKGDESTLAVWRELVDVSARAFQETYDRLGVSLRPEHLAGESTYNDHLDAVVDELLEKGILEESDGAIVGYVEGEKGPDGNPVPLIVRKANGSYGYGATDLATIRQRSIEGADLVLYVVDHRQALHFRQVFAIARRAGWLESCRPVHVPFGTVMGPDGKPFKTRAGKSVTLNSLLDEAEEAAGRIGIDAVKYADLSTSRVKDYVFDVERMTELQGNTSVYLQYSHARICSILARAGEAGKVSTGIVMSAEERALILRLDDFGRVVAEAAEASEPHRIAEYLFTLAKEFTAFYGANPVLKADPEARGNRIALLEWAKATLAKGLELLGIEAPDQM
ncbi:arginine--tRNA ligase [Salininema proteolyticum]|uniref:Arginine--tRNA ligase n=1 Tax=Salininema proteolyticum TaxID=1607685 RepID=A0ABV8U1C6_9ACTN